MANLSLQGKIGILTYLTLAICFGCSAQDYIDFNLRSTFNSAGIYWTPLDTSQTKNYKSGEIYYRNPGEEEWQQGYEIYWLPREDGRSEFRGSLVHLQSGTQYELKLKYREQEFDTTFQTWNEDFKVKKRIQINPVIQTFKTTEGGSIEEGYVVYEPLAGSDSILDAQQLHSYGIEVKHDWVIIRGWKIVNVRNHPIHLYPRANHIVIEYCDISRWGELKKNFAGDSYGVYIDGEDLIPSHIVVQYCYFHDPTYDSNNWSEPNDKTSAGNHPGGTQAFYMLRTGGSIVIRYNTITGSEDHYYNDSMGEWRNFGPHGFPYRDSDIHNNYISHCWDNAIESEGGNMNVRIYNNYTDSSYAHMGLSNITLGPLYLFNNVTNVAHKFPGDTDECAFLKIGNKLKEDVTTHKSWPCLGRAYVFNNTILQPAINGVNNGLTYFTTSSGPGNGTIYLNNIMHMTGNISASLRILSNQNAGIVNHNLYSGGYLEMTGAKNINDTPSYLENTTGFYLKDTSPGYQQGTAIPNFTVGDSGSNPDMGAYQNGSSPIVFGCGYDPITAPGTNNLVSITKQSDVSTTYFNCYPNPFHDHINININQYNETEIKIGLFNSAGRTLESYNIHFPENFCSKRLQLDHLGSGIYFIKLYSKSFIKTYSIFKI